tara:strand:- start:894 stop:1910 length:1017 start_codon:yes stop_codon:yes gene_type:complete
MKNMINGKVIFITGGTGSFGNAFVNELLLKYKPKKIIIYSRDELKQYEMKNSIPEKYQKIMRFFIGDVRDLSRLKLAVQDVDILIHAAALKHVPIAEYNPFEFIKTNIIGAQNVIEATINSGVKKVIALSTDKAAAPINLYGATKLTSDKLFVAANNNTGKKDISYSVVRYGNVMNSRGSVIPLFLKQKNKGFFTVTHKDMTRFNITLKEGVKFVLESLERMYGGEIFVPKIPSFKILDLARAISKKNKIKFIGIRPGEKLHEEMVTKSDSINTLEFNSFYTIIPNSDFLSKEKLEKFKNYKKKRGKKCSSDFSYNSNTNRTFLSVRDIQRLIKKELY